jgi:hypothetical protein
MSRYGGNTIVRLSIQPPPIAVVRSLNCDAQINFHYRPTPSRHDIGEAAHSAPSIPAFPNTL